MTDLTTTEAPSEPTPEAPSEPTPDARSAPAPEPVAAETWTVGRVRITKIVEMEVTIPGEMMMPTATADVVLAHGEALGPYANDDGWLTFAIHGLVLDDGERRILVDAGIGNAKSRAEPWFDSLDTRFLELMAEAGYPPASIDTVVATHLHADHVGWFTELVDGRWAPTFADARHLVVAEELAFWRSSPRALEPGYLDDSVAPVVDAGLVDAVEPDHVLTPEIRLVPTPGHSPGHVSVLVESDGESAIVTGDLIHHPIQVLEPDWDGPFDEDVVVSAATRRAFFARFADTATIVLGTHVATPTAGRIVTTETGWRWDPVASG